MAKAMANFITVRYSQSKQSMFESFIFKAIQERQRCLFLPPGPFSGWWSPKGRRGKENTLPVKKQVGFEPGTFGLQLDALAT